MKETLKVELSALLDDFNKVSKDIKQDFTQISSKHKDQLTESFKRSKDTAVEAFNKINLSQVKEKAEEVKAKVS